MYKWVNSVFVYVRICDSIGNIMTDNFGNNIVIHCIDYTKLHCHQFQHTIHTNIEPRLYTFKSTSKNMTLNTRKHQMEEQ